MSLLEVVLAMSLLVVLSSLTYWFYFSSISIRQRGIEEARKLRLARVVLDRIADEIRQTATVTKDFGVGLIGEHESIFLTTLRVPRKELIRTDLVQPPPPHSQYDLAHIQYKIARHPDLLHDDGYETSLGLARIEMPVPRRVAPMPASSTGGASGEFGSAGATDGILPFDPFADPFGSENESVGRGASLGPDINWEELYAPDIHYIRFCYYDGFSWWDDWGVSGDNPLPQLVQVTIGFGEMPPVGEETEIHRPNEEFCECLNRNPVDCLPLFGDQFSSVVRVTQADPLFRSRIAREGQAIVQEMSAAGGEEEEP